MKTKPVKPKTVMAKKAYRHYLPPDIAAARESVRVVLVGCGGGGSQMVSGLARLHAGLQAFDHPGLDLTVIDGDAVSASNVGRQLFSKSDIGMNKATVCVTRVNYFLQVKWKAVPFMLTKRTEHLLGDMDNPNKRPAIVITAVDSAKARIEIAGLTKLIPYALDLGNTKTTGQVILGTRESGITQPKRKDVIHRLPTVLDLYPDIEAQDRNEKIQGPTCSVADALARQDLFINQAVATDALNMLWTAFTDGFLEYHGVFLNLRPKKVERSLDIDPEAWARMGWTYVDEQVHSPRYQRRTAA